MIKKKKTSLRKKDSLYRVVFIAVALMFVLAIIGVRYRNNLASFFSSQPWSSIGGYVYDSNGQPVPGAQVTLAGCTATDVNTGTNCTTATDSNGYYEFDEVTPNKTFTVSAIMP